MPMTNTDLDLDDLDPTEDDLSDVEDVEDDVTVSDDDFDLDFDRNLHDDRYDTDGPPVWSAWA